MRAIFFLVIFAWVVFLSSGEQNVKIEFQDLDGDYQELDSASVIQYPRGDDSEDPAESTLNKPIDNDSATRENSEDKVAGINDLESAMKSDLKGNEDDKIEKRQDQVTSAKDIHKCLLPLGMEDGRIPDTAITASSVHTGRHRASRSRLNTVSIGSGGYGSWAAKTNSGREWLQIDLGGLTRVSRIATQGRQDSDQYVTLYILSYSVDGVHWAEYKVNSVTKVFSGNNDRNTVLGHNLLPPITARHVRFNVKAYFGHTSMRAELYGCRRIHSCAAPLGLEDGRITNSFITASSMLSTYYAPKFARLNHNQKAGAWIPKTQNTNQWLSIDLGQETSVTKVATQGRYNVLHYVTRYYLSSSMDGIHWIRYKVYSKDKQFGGISDANTVVSHALNPRIEGRFVRFEPKVWKSYIALRVEVYGCKSVPTCKLPLGIEDRRVADGAMTATTNYNAAYAAHKGRLNSKRSWLPKTNNKNQYLQVNFGRVVKITGVATQGRYHANQWVRSYTVSHSTDGSHWVYVKENSAVKISPANNDRHSIIRNHFHPFLFASMVRIHPVVWTSRIGMRVEFYGCSAGSSRFILVEGLTFCDACWAPLGVEDGRIVDKFFTASSMASGNNKPSRARLNTVKTGSLFGSWSAKVNNPLQWLQVDLGRSSTVTKMATQGRQDAHQWITSYTISYSLDGAHWAKYRLSDGHERVFGGNADLNTLVFIHFNPVIHAKFIRVHPRTWHGHISMRLELYGCYVVSNCMTPIGVEDGRIPAANIKASSIHNVNYAADRGRLNTVKTGSKEGTWCAKVKNANQWIQVRFDTPTVVTKVVTQGDQRANNFVKSYKLEFSANGQHWAVYKHNSIPVIFPGNFDSNTMVANGVFPVIYATFLRFRPVTWQRHICMRLEVYGCSAKGIGDMAVVAWKK